MLESRASRFRGTFHNFVTRESLICRENINSEPFGEINFLFSRFPCSHLPTARGRLRNRDGSARENGRGSRWHSTVRPVVHYGMLMLIMQTHKLWDLDHGVPVSVAACPSPSALRRGHPRFCVFASVFANDLRCKRPYVIAQEKRKEKKKNQSDAYLGLSDLAEENTLTAACRRLSPLSTE